MLQVGHRHLRKQNTTVVHMPVTGSGRASEFNLGSTRPGGLVPRRCDMRITFKLYITLHFAPFSLFFHDDSEPNVVTVDAYSVAWVLEQTRPDLKASNSQTKNLFSALGARRYYIVVPWARVMGMFSSLLNTCVVHSRSRMTKFLALIPSMAPTNLLPTRK